MISESGLEHAGTLICMPVFNDWLSASLLIEVIDTLGEQLESPISVLLIDDGSTQPPPTSLSTPLKVLHSVEVLQLRRNLGHQRAIAVGLTFIHAHRRSRFVVVMDSDGEDSPCDIEPLIARCAANGCNTIVFAKRAKRAESLLFCAGYSAYKWLHLVLTGRKVQVGNFSVMPFRMLNRIVAISELWNHYAAAVIHSRLPVEMVPIARRKRLAGRSQMNYVSLVAHGMSAISVYSDIVGVRLLCLTAVLIILAACGMVVTMGIRLFTSLAIPGWATTASGILGLALLNLLTLMMVFVLFVLQFRSLTSFIPVRDGQYFVDRHWTLAQAINSDAEITTPVECANSLPPHLC